MSLIKFKKFFALRVIIFVILSKSLIFNANIIQIKNAYNVTYEQSCNLLNSSNIQNSLKCFLVCQSILCKSLVYDKNTSNCTLYYGNPRLIKPVNLVNLTLNYIIGEY
jgi:hypothetical protein